MRVELGNLAGVKPVGLAGDHGALGAEVAMLHRAQIRARRQGCCNRQTTLEALGVHRRTAKPAVMPKSLSRYARMP